MLDMYDFNDDVWLCHSLQGQCYNFTAFVSLFFADTYQSIAYHRIW